MKFSTSRDNLLTPLQQVIGVIEKRQPLPVLSNVLIKLEGTRLEFTGTDTEVQLLTRSSTEFGDHGAITVPARKLLDICRQLPDHAAVNVECQQDRFLVQCARSRFTLSTLPADTYPSFDSGEPEAELTLPCRVLKRAMDKTLFAMALQDVRYYLNGLLLEVGGGMLRAVSSDGHRLAISEEAIDTGDLAPRQFILPRKGALELHKLLGGDPDEPLTLQIAANNIRAILPDLSFAAKLVDGRYPDYQRVMPKDVNRVVSVTRDALKAALTRVAILSNEKFRGVTLELEAQRMVLRAQNPEHEEAEDEVEISLEGDGVEIGFNAAYMLDAVSNCDADEIRMSFSNTTHSCLVEDVENPRFKFIVMPMRV
ncbi:MAG: DNA polymerase III subunit beta [Methylococcaceae bacterium]|nr:DNA polymerase III subunit beta [Methylococcaceae bacterium]